MTGLNHALTGAVIAITVKQPVLAPVLALLSHFLLDAVPHFGHPKLFPGKPYFKLYLGLEAVAMTTSMLTIMLLFPAQWFLVGLCAFLAFAPDILWYFRFYRADTLVARALRRYFVFAQRIQWYEKPPGGIVELAYLVVLVVVLIRLY